MLFWNRWNQESAGSVYFNISREKPAHTPDTPHVQPLSCKLEWTYQKRFYCFLLKPIRDNLAPGFPRGPDLSSLHAQKSSGSRLTWCREIKRCEESKRILKNPFASRLAEFNTTLKFLRITDQWYIFRVKFRFRRSREFLALLLLPLAGEPKDGKHFDADWRLITSARASIQAQIIVKGTRRNETATIKTVRKKPLKRWCDSCQRGDFVELSFVKQNVLQRCASKLLNEPPYGRQIKQTDATCFQKLVQWNHNMIIFY